MGLRDTLKNVARAAVAATGDIAVSANYASFGTTGYDASTGAVTPTFTSIEGISIILSDFAFEVIDGDNIQANDQKALLTDRSVSAVTPKPRDQLLINGESWEVVGVKTDPAEAAWTLQIRRP